MNNFSLILQLVYLINFSKILILITLNLTILSAFLILVANKKFKEENLKL